MRFLSLFFWRDHLGGSGYIGGVDENLQNFYFYVKKEAGCVRFLRERDLFFTKRGNVLKDMREHESG